MTMPPAAPSPPPRPSPFPHDQQPPAKRQWWKAAWFIALVAAIVGIGIGAASGSAKTKTVNVAGPTTTATATATETATVTATPTVIKTIATHMVTATVTYTPPPPPPPTTVFSLNGSGIKNTPDFVVSSAEWVIHYSYDCSAYGSSGNFAISVSSTNGGPADGDVAANEIGASGNSSSVEHGAGTYYLAINSECNWQVVVTQ